MNNKKIFYKKRRIHKKREKGEIFLKAVKYLLIITAVLFAAVFVITRFAKEPDNPPENASETEAGTAASAETSAPEEENQAMIDNEWAMFIVNSKNPLPDDYDVTLNTTVVYENEWREYYFDSRAAEYLETMLKDAAEEGVDLLLISTYRTMQYQKQNFDKSVQDRVNGGMTYEEAYADTLMNVALPGMSDHNAGLGADIMTTNYTSMDDAGFEDTEAFKWLKENAKNYGFILRYPKDKFEYTGIIYEPWHYRFVGIYYAHEIEQSGLSLEEFYESKGWLDENGKAVKMQGPSASVSVVPTAPDETSASSGTSAATTAAPPEQQVSIIV